jgi:hypothetical protein
MKPSITIAIIFLAVVSIAQMTRFLLRIEVWAGGILIPPWWSLPASVFTGALAIWLWLENRGRSR